MKVTRILAALAFVTCFAGAANAAPGCIRLSWNTCDPWVADQAFTGPSTYNLVVSAFGVSSPNVGTDLNIHVKAGGSGAVPDSWRFDDAGCQTSSQLVPGTAALSKACPIMKGANSLTITNYAINGTGEADLRLAITYDTFNPLATTRYTVWQVAVNHAFSNVGPTPADLSTCGGVEQCEFLTFTSAILLAATGQPENFAGCDVPIPGTQPAATWQAGGTCPVAAQPATWGKVKGLYR